MEKLPSQKAFWAKYDRRATGNMSFLHKDDDPGHGFIVVEGKMGDAELLVRECIPDGCDCGHESVFPELSHGEPVRVYKDFFGEHTTNKPCIATIQTDTEPFLV